MLQNRPSVRLAGSLLGLAVALACRGGDERHEPAPRAMASRDALLLASAKVALPPPVDPATALPDPTSQGARLVTQYCTACHEVPTPQIHSPTDWPRVARRMWLRIDGLPADVEVPRPGGAERTVMLRYLISHGLQVSGAALPAAPGRTEFVATCSRCHELPDPRSHSADHWPGVVARMGERMTSMLGAGLGTERQTEIERYLSAAAGPR